MIEKTIKMQKRLDKYARRFCSYLLWTDEYEFWRIADEIGWVFYVNEMFFSLQDAMFLSIYPPEEILEIYSDYEDYEWDVGNIINYVKLVRGWEDDCECDEQDLTEAARNSFEIFIDSLNIPDYGFERKFIMSLSTWEILYSIKPWEFKASSDKGCFIDQTEHYLRVGWQEGKDFIWLN